MKTVETDDKKCCTTYHLLRVRVRVRVRVGVMIRVLCRVRVRVSVSYRMGGSFLMDKDISMLREGIIRVK